MRAASRARAASSAFLDDPPGDRGVFLEVRAEFLVDDGVDDALDLAVAELGLGLAFELRVGHLDADDGGQAFADVVAGHRLGRRP